MNAVEFNAKVADGKIEVPMEYLHDIHPDVKIIMLYESTSAPMAKQKNPSRKNKSIKGIISHYANPDLIPLEKDAWGEAVKDKYAVS